LNDTSSKDVLSLPTSLINSIESFYREPFLYK